MKCQREKFQLQRKYAYLNCAYMSPLMKKVENAGIKGMKKKRKPFHISPDDFFHDTETLRRLYSQLIDNSEPDRVVVIPSASYGIANVVHNLPGTPGKIILADEQFPSNVYPWQSLESSGYQICVVTPPKSSARAQSWNQALLDEIDDKTRVVALGQVHWSDGTLFQLKEIREKLDKVGGLLVIDGTQSVGALPFSIKEIRPDALICAGYKWLMGPYSIGLAYYGEAFDKGKPIEENWINRLNSENFAELVNYQPAYRDGALKYEVGEHSNFILIPMLLTAIKQLLKWTPEGIQQYCDVLMQEAISELCEMGYKIEEAACRGHHLFGIRLPEKVSPEVLGRSLKQHRVSVSFRGSAIRVSPHVYNDEMDVRKLLNAMKAPIFASKG
ncbi:MAG: aminotransferase class V-fold PLP-dependent enzyme [Ekhidna sp.]